LISKELGVAELKEVLERKQESLSRLWEPRLQGQLLDELPHLEVGYFCISPQKGIFQIRTTLLCSTT